MTERRGFAAGIDPETGAPEIVERFAYDARGLLVRAENGDGVVAIERDKLGRVVSERLNGRAVESRYDGRGRRVERRIGDRVAAYAYDPLGALTDLTLAGSGETQAIAFARDALGREVARQGGAFRLEQAFDPLGQLVRQRAGSVSGERGSGVLERRYAWNKVFEPTAIADGLWGGTAYAYDANGQVTEARHGEGLPAPAADAGAGLFGLPGEQVEVERFAYEATRDIAASDTALPGEPLGRVLTPWLSTPGGKVRAARGAEPPGETTHWTAAAMSKAAAINVSSVQRIWRGHGLQPHRVRQFKLSTDPAFAAKLRDVVGLYVDPPAHAVVLSVDDPSTGSG